MHRTAPFGTAATKLLAGAAFLAHGGVALADPPACTCDHLKALQIELKNARTLQTRFEQESAVLKSMSSSEATQALKAFAQGPASAGIHASPGYTGPDSVEYVPQGDNVYSDALGGRSDAQLCEFSNNTKNDLERAARGSQCADIAEAIRAHEAFHRSRCLAVGYRSYSAVGGAQRAQEEAAAYGAQALRLREGIRRVLAGAQVDVTLDTDTHIQMPPNPLYTGIDATNHAKGSAKAVSQTATELRFEGDAPEMYHPKALGGSCTIENVPMQIQGHLVLTTDGETATIRWTPQGTVPSFGMTCRVGKASGHGISMPVPASPGSVPSIPIAFEDGASTHLDMKDSPLASMTAGSPVKFSGGTDVQMKLVCKPAH